MSPKPKEGKEPGRGRGRARGRGDPGRREPAPKRPGKPPFNTPEPPASPLDLASGFAPGTGPLPSRSKSRQPPFPPAVEPRDATAAMRGSESPVV